MTCTECVTCTATYYKPKTVSHKYINHYFSILVCLNQPCFQALTVGTASEVRKAWKWGYAQLVQTAHTKPSSSNPLGEKGDKHPECSVCSNSSSVRHPMTHVLPCDLYLCCSTWMHGALQILPSLNSLDGAVWVCIYVLCLLRKGCGSWIAWLEIRNLAELFIESCILVQIYSVISPSQCKDRIFIGLP